MHPTICSIGPLTVQSYGLMLALAVLVCGFLAGREAHRVGMTKEVLFDLVFWTVGGGIVGARIFFILLNLGYFLENPVEIVMIQNGGLAWQGGLLLGGYSGWRFVRRRGLPLWPVLDFAAPYLALGQSIGRIGCFLTGCCYGRPAPWGVYFPVHHERLIPTQLFQVAALFLIFVILRRYQKGPHRAGQVFVLYLGLAALQRFIIEFFRADHTATVLGLSVFQCVTVVIGLAAFFLHVRITRRAP